MQQFKNDIITESHYNSLVANDINLQDQITMLSDLAGGGASNLLTTNKTLIGAINENKNNIDKKDVVRYLLCSDTRNIATNPVDLASSKAVSFDFKTASTIGLSNAWYSGVMTYRPYGYGNDWSGGPAHQIAFNEAGLYWRESSGDTSWSNWYNIITEATIKRMDNTAPRIFLLPYMHYSSLPSKSTDNSVYFKEYLQFLVKNYSSLGDVTISTIFMGIAHPNSVGNMIINIYTIANYNNTGLPRYSSGLYIPLTGSPGSLAHFGTVDGSYHYTAIS